MYYLARNVLSLPLSFFGRFHIRNQRTLAQSVLQHMSKVKFDIKQFEDCMFLPVYLKWTARSPEINENHCF